VAGEVGVEAFPANIRSGNKGAEAPDLKNGATEATKETEKKFLVVLFR
jgi:hypothetical protein